MTVHDSLWQTKVSCMNLSMGYLEVKRSEAKHDWTRCSVRAAPRVKEHSIKSPIFLELLQLWHSPPPPNASILRQQRNLSTPHQRHLRYQPPSACTVHHDFWNLAASKLAVSLTSARLCIALPCPQTAIFFFWPSQPHLQIGCLATCSLCFWQLFATICSMAPKFQFLRHLPSPKNCLKNLLSWSSYLQMK